MRIASSNGLQQYFSSILESHSSSRILEFEQGDMCLLFERREILQYCDFSKEKQDSQNVIFEPRMPMSFFEIFQTIE